MQIVSIRDNCMMLFKTICLKFAWNVILILFFFFFFFLGGGGGGGGGAGGEKWREFAWNV